MKWIECVIVSILFNLCWILRRNAFSDVGKFHRRPAVFKIELLLISACLPVGFFSPFAAQSNVTDSVLEVVAYEARRLFRDRLVSLKDVHAFDNILSSIVRGDWGSDALDNMTGGPSCSILTGRHLRQTHAYKDYFF